MGKWRGRKEGEGEREGEGKELRAARQERPQQWECTVSLFSLEGPQNTANTQICTKTSEGKHGGGMNV